MRIPRIFQPGPLEPGGRVELSALAAGHLTRVLRLRSGAPVVLFNGEGGEYPSVLDLVERGSVTARVERFIPREAESPLSITLVQGISRGERMDYTIQKAVELGVTRIVPVTTERTVVNLRGERRDRRQERWQAVAVAACEQCGRNRVPPVDEVTDLADWLARTGEGVTVMLDHRASGGVGALSVSGPIYLLVGPEGGLSEGEREKAAAVGAIGIRLGPRVLRTETAGLTALAALQLRFGDLG